MRKHIGTYGHTYVREYVYIYTLSTLHVPAFLEKLPGAPLSPRDQDCDIICSSKEGEGEKKRGDVVPWLAPPGTPQTPWSFSFLFFFFFFFLFFFTPAVSEVCTTVGTVHTTLHT